VKYALHTHKTRHEGTFGMIEVIHGQYRWARKKEVETSYIIERRYKNEIRSNH